MNAFEGIIDNLNNQDLPFIEKTVHNHFNETWEKFENYVKKIQNAIEVYKKTGEEPNIVFSNWEETENISEINSNSKSLRGKHSKENIKPDENVINESTLRTRPRRNAFKEATQSISQISSMSLNTKLRQQPVNANGVAIKKEKQSKDNDEEITELKVITKIEKDEMPAPTRPAPRKKRQKKSEMIIKQEVKQEKIDEETVEDMLLINEDSDVVLIEDKDIPTINLLDSDNEKTIQNEDENNKQNKTQKKGGKRTRTHSDGKDEENRDKKSRSHSPVNINGNVTTETHYEDANSNLEDIKENNNATFVTQAPHNKNLASSNAVMNATVVVSNPKFTPRTAEDLITDDESEDEKKKKKTPPKTVTKIAKSKQVFSPFEPSPVKKKIQAFEKLQEENSTIPVRITRTKTKARAKEQEENEANQVEPKSVVKEKAKFFTPATSKFIPTASSTNIKGKPNTPSLSSESLSTTKLASSLKVSQYEYKQREKRRKEKEEEALKKREALLQAQIEEKKKKREEKQLKAQQQREALEKEKLKALEIQRLKDERHKQLIAEQEEKKQKQKEELEKKRMMAKMRAIEEKKKEEERRMEEFKKTQEISAKLAKQDEVMVRMVQKQKIEREQQKTIPIYMKTKPALLPTPDCYDSDDERFEHDSATWEKKANLIELEILTLAVSEAFKNSFFSRLAQTPDLVDIFEVIEPQKLKRSSSAVWLKPPRFTMMLHLEKHDENQGFETDDE